MSTMSAWRLDAPGITWVFSSQDAEIPCCLYGGPALPAGEDLAALALALQPMLPNAQLDRFAPLSLSPEARLGWFGHPGLILGGAEGPIVPRFTLLAVEEGEGALTWTLHDPVAGLTLSLSVALDGGSGVLTAQTGLTSDRQIDVYWLPAPVLPVADMYSEMLDFVGRWIGEFQPQRAPLRAGAHVRVGREGRTGHATPPYVAFVTDRTSMTEGAALGLQLAWSGGHRAVVEELPDGRRHVQMGPEMTSAPLRLGAGVRADSPTLIVAWTSEGLGGLARAFHRHIRRSILRLPKPQRPRPVHYNCWEAVYFDHDLQVLKDSAARAAALGAERFVLDDGWFMGRVDDGRALGDWTVDPIKFPQGLTPLIDHVAQLGMAFGLWVEPEMISAESALYAAHPDWVLGDPIDSQPPGRRQYVLDLSINAVVDTLFDRIDALLSEYPIDYLKWDHNRPLIGAGPAQAEAVYALFDRLRAAHPDVEIESCSSGGGRIDLGILARTHRVWLSDSNDALRRLTMQHWAGLMIPPEITGSHVGPRTCHTSSRVLPMGLRAWVAAQRHMGLELDPRDITDAEAATLSGVIAWWKRNRRWLHASDLYPLDPPDPAVVAEMQVAADGGRFVLFIGQTTESARSSPRAVTLAGLIATARYRVRLINDADMHTGLSVMPAGITRAGAAGVTLSGQALMQAGLALPASMPATLWVLEGERLSA